MNLKYSLRNSNLQLVSLNKRKNLRYAWTDTAVEKQRMSIHGGTNLKDFLSGLMAGISIGEVLVKVFLIGRSFAKQ